MPTRIPFPLSLSLLVLVLSANAAAQSQPAQSQPIVLHAARLLDVKTGRVLKRNRSRSAPSLRRWQPATI
jgi:hypothetical protein